MRGRGRSRGAAAVPSGPRRLGHQRVRGWAEAAWTRRRAVAGGASGPSCRLRRGAVDAAEDLVPGAGSVRLISAGTARAALQAGLRIRPGGRRLRRCARRLCSPLGRVSGSSSPSPAGGIVAGRLWQSRRCRGYRDLPSRGARPPAGRAGAGLCCRRRRTPSWDRSRRATPGRVGLQRRGAAGRRCARGRRDRERAVDSVQDQHDHGLAGRSCCRVPGNPPAAQRDGASASTLRLGRQRRPRSPAARPDRNGNCPRSVPPGVNPLPVAPRSLVLAALERRRGPASSPPRHDLARQRVIPTDPGADRQAR